MGCNTLASRCITRFLYKWGLFVMPIYHEIGQMWRPTRHTLYYTCSTELHNHILLGTEKLYTLIHVKAHPVICHPNHWFHVTRFTCIAMWNGASRPLVDNMPKQIAKKNLDIRCKVKRKLIREKVSHLIGCLTIWHGLKDGESQAIGAMKYVIIKNKLL